MCRKWDITLLNPNGKKAWTLKGNIILPVPQQKSSSRHLSTSKQEKRTENSSRNSHDIFIINLVSETTKTQETTPTQKERRTLTEISLPTEESRSSLTNWLLSRRRIVQITILSMDLSEWEWAIDRFPCSDVGREPSINFMGLLRHQEEGTDSIEKKRWTLILK